MGTLLDATTIEGVQKMLQSQAVTAVEQTKKAKTETLVLLAP